MALVAYGSSDSDTSDTEQQAPTATTLNKKPSAPSSRGEQSVSPDQGSAAGSVSETKLQSHKPAPTTEDVHFSDEDDFMPSNISDEGGGTSGGLHLPAPKMQTRESQNINSLAVNSSIDSSHSQSSLLKGLPAPQSKSQIRFKGYQAEDEGELEDLVKPTSKYLYQEKPIPQPKTRNTVKITVPTLHEYNSDEEGEPNKKKRKKVVPHGSGLTSLLPEPVHAPKKEVGRVLLPYSMSRKPKTPTTTTTRAPGVGVPKSSAASAAVHLAGIPTADSDSEPEDDHHGNTENFFSLSDDTRVPTLKETPLPSASLSKGTDLYRYVKLDERPLLGSTDVPGQISAPSEPPLGADRSGLQDAPLQFRGASGSAGHADAEWTGGSSTGVYHGNHAYNMAEGDEIQEDIESAQGEEGEGELFQDEQFLRMQGKTGRSREQVDFIDVNADDMTSSTDFLKGFSEETEMKSHSKKKNKDMPSSQQKRKHQITYLAFKAKEREMDLKNQWADNKMTKKHTQSKYGF